MQSGSENKFICTVLTFPPSSQGNVSGGPEERPLLLGVFSRYLNVPEKFIELPGIQGEYLNLSRMLSIIFREKDLIYRSRYQ